MSMKCTLIGSKYVQVFVETDTIARLLKEGGSIGFAIALESGRFNVSRFSLDGSTEAIRRAVDPQRRARHGDSNL